MCGIAGVFSTKLDLYSDPVRSRLGAMQAALAHRGPDGQGDYISPSGNAALCHSRLSIIDLSSTGHQPMVSQDQRYAISFNGEIYNYQSLRAELEEQGEVFVSTSDTEVLLKLYALEGEQCVHRLRGMFAFAIWDEVEQRAFAARDPIGIKPLYYCHTSDQNPADRTLALASELRSLMHSDLHDWSLSPDGLGSYFLHGSVAEPHTLIKDIMLLPAGHTLCWRAGSVTINKYWGIEFSKRSVHPEEAIKRTRTALESSVKAHFVSDVPVGIFLSGGIDSTALVALASQVTNTKLNTYSVAFEAEQWNEGEVAKRVSDHFGTHHTEFLVTPDIAKPMFEEFLAAVDQPTIDGFNTFCISKLASQAGEKVVLSGLGGDELFAGYKSFEILPKLLRVSGQLSLLSPLFRFCNSNLKTWLPSKILRILDFLSQPNSVIAAHRSLRGIFSTHEASTLCLAHGVKPPTLQPRTRTHNTLADEISALELNTYMRNQLLRDADVMSMACGLELRVPFVDKELMEAVADIPSDIRLKQGKQLLINAVPELPEWVVTRPKQGFRFPFDEWFSKEWKELLTDDKAPDWIKLKPWYRRWSLSVLQDWRHRHLDQY